MIIPLGLGLKFKKFPIITLILCMASIIYYAKDPRRPEKVADKIKEAYRVSRFGYTEAALFKDYCVAEGGEETFCDDLRGDIAKEYDFKGKTDEGDDSNRDRYDRLRARLKSMTFEEFSKEQVRYELITERFVKETKNPDDEFQRLANFAGFDRARAFVRDTLSTFYQHESLLSSESITPRSVAIAQFSHGSLMHLIGNMIFLLVFGAYVEQRMNGLLYVGIYLLGGSMGLLSQIFLFKDPEYYLVGASANISAVMGLFFIYFFRFRMKFLVFLGLAGRTFYAPVAVMFPILYILDEFVAAMGGVHMGTNVAHFAHLGGLCVGVYAGFLTDSFKPVPWPFLYPREKDDFEKLKARKSLTEKLSLGEYILGYNQQNSVVRFYLLAQCLEAVRNTRLVDARIRDFLARNLALAVEEKVRTKRVESAFQLMCQCPVQLSFDSVLDPSITPPSILKLGDFAADRGNLMMALRFYDLYLLKYPRSRKQAALVLTVKEILKHLPRSEESAQAWAEYIQFHKNSVVVPMFRASMPEETVTMTDGGVNGRAASKA